MRYREVTAPMLRCGLATERDAAVARRTAIPHERVARRGEACGLASSNRRREDDKRYRRACDGGSRLRVAIDADNAAGSRRSSGLSDQRQCVGEQRSCAAGWPDVELDLVG